MAQFVSDTFTAAAGTALESHTGETGATWTFKNEGDGGWTINSSGRIVADTAGGYGGTYASGTPATGEYDVTADYYIAGTGGRWRGVAGRMATADESCYAVAQGQTLNTWSLIRMSSDGLTSTVLGAYAQTLTIGNTYAVKLEIRDATKKVFIDGVERISSTDNTITAAGRVGVYGRGGTTNSDLDNFTATDAGGAEIINGSLTITEADDAVSATGDPIVSGTLEATEADDIYSIAASVPISGDLGSTEEADSITASGTLPLAAALSVTEADDTLSSIISSGEARGTLSMTEEDDAASAAGVVLMNGELNITEVGDSIASEGAVLASGQATLAEEADVLVSVSATIVSGVAAVLEASDTLSASMQFDAAHAVFEATEADDTGAATASVTVSGQVSTIEAGDTGTSVGTVTVGGTLATAEDGDTSLSGVSVLAAASLNTQEGNDVLSATGDSSMPFADLDLTEGDDTLSVLVGVEINGSGEIQEGDDTLEAGDREEPAPFYGGGGRKRKSDVDLDYVREQWELVELRHRQSETPHEQTPEPAPVATAKAQPKIPQPVAVSGIDEEEEIMQVVLAVLDYLE